MEAGAADGKTHSNTLYLELKRSWTGLLIEPNPEYFQDLLVAKRNAYVINTCLSSTRRSETVQFKALGLFGGVVGRIDDTQLKFVEKTASLQNQRYHCAVFHVVFNTVCTGPNTRGLLFSGC